MKISAALAGNSRLTLAKNLAGGAFFKHCQDFALAQRDALKGQDSFVV